MNGKRHGLAWECGMQNTTPPVIACIAALMVSVSVTPVARAQTSHITSQSGDWQEIGLQGYVLYTTASGTGPDRNLLEISCEVGSGANHPPSVNVLIKDENLTKDARVEFRIGDQVMAFPSGLDDMEAQRFAKLWAMLRNGRELEVEVGDGRRVRFSLRGSASVMPATPCGVPAEEEAARDASLPVSRAPAATPSGSERAPDPVDRFLRGLLPTCEGAPAFNRFRTSLRERYGYNFDGSRIRPDRPVLIPPGIRPAMGRAVATNEGEYTKVVVPLTGRFHVLAVLALEFHFGNENGINSTAIVFDESPARARAVLETAVSEGTRHLQTAAESDEPHGAVGIAEVGGRAALVCDLST